MLDLYTNNNPVVSVIMATFNRATLLHRSISSFINQTFKNAELIVVDDGSTDNSFENDRTRAIPCGGGLDGGGVFRADLPRQYLAVH